MATQQNNGLGFIAALITGAVSLTSTIVSAVSKRKERKAAEKMQQAQLEYEQQLQEQQEAEAAAAAATAARQAKIAAQEQRAAERKAKIAAELPVLKANYEQQKAKTKRNWIIAGIATATFLVVLATDNKKKR